MNDRPLARLLGALALTAAAAIAIPRVRLDAEPRVGGGELIVSVGSADTTTPDDVARRLLLPVEQALREAGGTFESTGRVGSSGGFLRIRYEAGTDLTTKTAQILVLLEPLRRSLRPEDQLNVFPTTTDEDGRAAALLSLTGPDAVRRAEDVAAELGRIPGVRSARTFGSRTGQLLVETRTDDEWLAEAIRAELSAPSTRLLGLTRKGVFRLPFASLGEGGELGSRPIAVGRRAIPATSLARFSLGESPSRLEFQADGKPGVAIVVEARPDAPILGLVGDVTRTATALERESRGRIRLALLDDAGEPIRRLLIALAIALCGLAVAGFVAGVGAGVGTGAWLAGVPILGAVLTASFFHLASLPLDSSTLPPLLVALAGATAAAALRTRAGIGSAPLLLAAGGIGPAIGAVLLGGALAPPLGAPTRALLLSALAGAVAATLPPRPAARHASGKGRRLRGAFRDSASAALALGSALLVLGVLFAGSLDPRAAPARRAAEEMTARLSFPDGTSSSAGAGVAAIAAERLLRLGGVTSTLAFIEAGSVDLRIRISPSMRTIEKQSELRLDIVRTLRPLAPSVSVRSPIEATADPGQLLASTLSHPAAPEGSPSYSVVLRSTDLHGLLELRERVIGGGVGAGFGVGDTFATIGAASPRLAIVPRPDAPGAALDRLAAALRGQTTPPSGIPLPGAPPESTALVRRPGAPAGDDDLPFRSGLLTRPFDSVVPTSLGSIREQMLPPWIGREQGSFVLPITFTAPKTAFGEQLRTLDRRLRSLRLPSGTDLDLPSPGELWTPARRRVVALAAFVPLLLAALATIRLGSILSGFLSLAPAALAVGTAAGFLRFTSGRADLVALVTLTAVLSALLPGAVAALARFDAPASERYAGARRSAAASRVLGLAAVALAAAALSAGRPLPSFSVALLAAAGGLGAGALGSGLLLPALAHGTGILIRRDRAEVERMRNPPEWIRPGSAHLSLRSVTKRYGAFRALTDVTFELGPGVVGLLGPNGAGKTTLLRLVIGLLEPSRGGLTYRGVPLVPEDRFAFRKLVGYLPQEFNAYPDLTGEAFLHYWALERGLSDRRQRTEEVERLLRTVDLVEAAGRRVRDYSGGMRQRIGVARALIGSPPLLIVDEPTTGLDVESRGRLRETLLAIAADRIVLLSTHLAGDVEATAGRILLLHHGRLRYDGSPDELVKRARGRVFETVVSDTDLRELSRKHRVTARVRVLDGIRVRGVITPGEPLPGGAVEPNLEEAYLAALDAVDATGGEARRRTSRLSIPIPLGDSARG